MKQENPFNEIVETKEIDGVITIDARELHKRLKVKTRFNDWINRRINEYEFIRFNEYVRRKIDQSEKKVGRPRKEYNLTLSMACHLCIIENTELGKSLRIKLQKVINEQKISGLN